MYVRPLALGLVGVVLLAGAASATERFAFDRLRQDKRQNEQRAQPRAQKLPGDNAPQQSSGADVRISCGIG